MCKNIIGVSRNPSICLHINEDQKISKSGLFLDDTSAGSIPLKPAFYKDTEMLDFLISDAVSEANASLLIALDSRLLKNIYATYSTIGFKDNYTENLPSTVGYNYVKLVPKSIRGGLITLDKIQFIGDTQDFNILITQAGEEVYTGLLSAYKPVTLGLDRDITISYYNDGSIVARNIKHSPCCGEIVNYNRFISVFGGFTGNLNNTTYSDSLTRGLFVECSFDCDPLSTICNLDFKRHTFAIQYAKLVQQIARKNIVLKIQMDPVVSAYSMLKTEELSKIFDYILLDIEKSLKYLPEAYNYSDCYTCTGYYIHENMI